MILADINWLNITVDLLLVVFVIVCLLMALLILMQRPKQEGLGAAFGGGVTDQVFGARTTNVLQKGTVYLGSMFFILALTLAILIGKQTKQKSLLDDSKTPTTAVEPDERKSAEEPIFPGDVIPVEDTPGPAPEGSPAPPTGDTPTPPAGETPAPPADGTPVPPVEGTPAPDAVTPPSDAVQPPAVEPTPPAGEENKADKPE